MSLETQRQIRENFGEAQTYLRDLYQWEREVKKQEAARKLDRGVACPPRRRVEMELSASVKTQLHDVTSAMPLDDADDHPSDALTRAEQRRQRGNAFFRDGDYGHAIALYTESLELNPTAVSAANRAMAYLKLREFRKAVQDCDAALELDAGFLKAYQRRSVARKELGDLNGALDDAEMALRLQPTSDAIRATFSELLEGVLHSEQLRIDRRRQPIPPLETSHQPEPANGVVSEPDEPPSDPTTAVAAQKLSMEIPGVPTSWAEFEGVYKSLKHRPLHFYRYLAALPPNSLPSVFKSALSAPVLVSILEAAIHGLRENQDRGHWIAFLEQLKGVPRYEMLLMCLTPKQKQHLRTQFQTLPAELEPLFKSIL